MNLVLVSPADWISVKERLPERDGRYLAVAFGDIWETTAVNEGSIAVFIRNPDEYGIKCNDSGSSKWFCKDANSRYFDGTGIITHWLPLM